MNLITSTQLRTDTSKLIEALLDGKTVNFIHRSKIIGEFRPKKTVTKIFNAKRVEKLAHKLNLEPLSYQERERRYRSYMIRRHGQNIPRHK